MMTPQSSAYTRTIHALAHRLRMTDEQYRDMLRDNFGVDSSKALSDEQARSLCAALMRKLPRTEVNKKKPTRFSELADRDSNYATPVQLRMLEAAFVQRSFMPTLHEKQIAFTVFIKNKFGIVSTNWIEKSQVGKIMSAITHLKKSDQHNTMEAYHG